MDERERRILGRFTVFFLGAAPDRGVLGRISVGLFDFVQRRRVATDSFSVM